MSEFRRVGVIGGGLMGSGIVQVAALGGFVTVCREVGNAQCERAHASVRRWLEKGVEKGKVTAEARDAALGRMSFVTDLAAAAGTELVIEAIVEDLAEKQALWRALDPLAPATTVFASNTSSLSIAAQASTTTRGDRFIGMHFFSPVPMMPLVEIVRTVTTGDDAYRLSHEFVRRVGKVAIDTRDTPGFVVNRLLVPYMLDAIRALEQGTGSVRDIDVGMTLGAGHPMGPLALCDFVGLDTLLRVAESMYGEYREPRFAPPPLLKRIVVSGMFGRKNGIGFYRYGGDEPEPGTFMG
jgi:3-hydroxybutyryl-CoA dehydrogenase